METTYDPHPPIIKSPLTTSQIEEMQVMSNHVEGLIEVPISEFDGKDSWLAHIATDEFKEQMGRRFSYEIPDFDEMGVSNISIYDVRGDTVLIRCVSFYSQSALYFWDEEAERLAML